MLLKIFLFLSIPITIGLVILVRSKLDDNQKKFLLYGLWVFILIFTYLTYSSISNVIQFDKIKNYRYQSVIKNLKDIRDSQLAHRTIHGHFENNWDSLVKFVQTDSFTITQRRDSSVIDRDLTKRYGGVKTYKDIIIVDTLGFVSVKDSLFGENRRFLNMMYVPFAKTNTTKFELKAGFLNQNGIDIPVFESKVMKKIILHDQEYDLIFKENQVQSVDGVNGSSLKIGSMNEVNTNGNWPKNYTK
ncbi:MAG TPA: hypothetical protein QGI27_02665, partial [Flavobacteriaceae bacterium]|nr:hypothetical protein [Flavobacteriaceae bacterium]